MKIKNNLLKLDIQKFADGQIEYKIGVDDKEVSRLATLGKSVGSAFVKGTAVASGALVALVGKSVSAYANLEQSIGGVETLFKNSAQTVIDNANIAYKTAGMSANAYMETVTSFSASLLQGLGGDTKKAAKIADMAIIDMSDNANKMGTSMELIQNAYQGFAKQNYTMLDNLKLGYGGTQSEMARLINDSGVLGDTMTVTAETVNQVSFDKMIEAIHKVQENMGITGTTAKEASETISGSVNSAKAAWENFLSGSGDISTVISTFETAGTNIMNAIVKMLPQIVQGIVALLDALIPQLPGLIQKLLPTIISGAVQLVMGLISALPQLIQALSSMLPQIITTVINGLMQIGQELINQLPVIIPQIIEALIGALAQINEHFDEFLMMGIKIILALIQGLINSIPLILQNLPTILMAILNFFTISKFLGLGKNIINGLWNGAKGLVPSLRGWISGLGKNILEFFKHPLKGIKNIGRNLVQGLWNGIRDARDWILNKIKGFGKSILNGIKDFFGIHSPSTEFAWVGRMNILGLEKGMEDMQPDLAKTINKTVAFDYDTSGLDYLSNGLENISGNIVNSVSPNYNNSSNIYVTVNADMDVNKFGKVFVKDIKTFSGGSKNSYNYGGGK